MRSDSSIRRIVYENVNDFYASERDKLKSLIVKCLNSHHKSYHTMTVLTISIYYKCISYQNLNQSHELLNKCYINGKIQQPPTNSSVSKLSN